MFSLNYGLEISKHVNFINSFFDIVIKINFLVSFPLLHVKILVSLKTSNMDNNWENSIRKCLHNIIIFILVALSKLGRLPSYLPKWSSICLVLEVQKLKCSQYRWNSEILTFYTLRGRMRVNVLLMTWSNLHISRHPNYFFFALPLYIGLLYSLILGCKMALLLPWEKRYGCSCLWVDSWIREPDSCVQERGRIWEMSSWHFNIF